MTLKQAHTQWSAVPKHTVWAIKTRNYFQKVLLDHCGEIDVTLIDKHYIELLLKDCKESQKFRVNAISVLCHLLTWLHDREPEVYPAPDFTLDIASFGRKYTDEQAVSPSSRPSVSEKRPSTPTTSNNSKKEKAMEVSEKKIKKTANASRVIIQLDPSTLKEVARFGSATEAAKTIGIIDVSKPARTHTPGGGFYWAYVDEYNEEWKPAPVKSRKGISNKVNNGTAIASHQAHHRPTPESIKVSAHVVKVLSEASDDVLLAEIQRRANWHGDFTIERKYTL